MSSEYTSQMPSCGREPFTFDWKAFYLKHDLEIGVDQITSSVWAVTNGSKANEFINGADTTVFLFGGTTGVTLSAHNTIQINGGTYITCETIELEIT